MDLISIPTSISSIRIFPDLYEDDDRVFYHGTSEYYSNQIEQFGLFPNYKPITEYFYSLFNFADKVYPFTTKNNNNFGDFNKAFTDAFQYFKDFLRISFSAVSYSAAYYSIGRMAGGQGLRHLFNLKTELSKINFSLLDNAIINVSESEKYFYETVDDEIEKIRNSNGVVYAFKLNSCDRTHLSYENHSYHSVLLSFSHIPPSKIVAKMIIPNKIKLDQTLLDESNRRTLYLSNPVSATSFIKDILFYNYEQSDFHEYLNSK